MMAVLRKEGGEGEGWWWKVWSCGEEGEGGRCGIWLLYVSVFVVVVGQWGGVLDGVGFWVEGGTYGWVGFEEES